MNTLNTNSMSLEQEAAYVAKTYSYDTVAGQFAIRVLNSLPHNTIQKLQAMPGVFLQLIKFADSGVGPISVEYSLNYIQDEDDPEDNSDWHTYQDENQDTIAILDVNKPLEVLSLENGTFKTITRNGQEVFLQFYKSVPLNLVD